MYQQNEFHEQSLHFVDETGEEANKQTLRGGQRCIVMHWFLDFRKCYPLSSFDRKRLDFISLDFIWACQWMREM